MPSPFTRRALLASSATVLALPLLNGSVLAETPQDLEWSDLVPDGSSGETMDRLRNLGVVQHGQLSTPFEQDTRAQLTRDYDGKLVRLPGYVVPLDFEGTFVKAFLLVPYVGACIHVPPPPPNQLVFVTTETPYNLKGLFEPVIVTGTFGAAATATTLAEVGYSMTAQTIVPYG